MEARGDLMPAPMKILGTGLSLTLGVWRVRVRFDIDEVYDDAEEQQAAAPLRRRSPDTAHAHVTLRRPS
jgi:hypothetical protein